MPDDNRVCRRHWNIGVRAVKGNPKYAHLPVERKRKLAGAIGRALEKKHGKAHCDGPVETF